MEEAVIERRLTFEEVQNVCGAALAFTANVRQPLASLKAEIRPDVSVCIRIAFRFLAFQEPGVFLTCVPGNQVKEHMHIPFVCLIKQGIEILIGSITGCDFLVVADVIAGILKGRVKAGVDPECITPKTFDIIQLLYNAWKITDAVSICIQK